MKSNIQAFKQLDDELYKKIVFDSEIKFFYSDSEGYEVELSVGEDAEGAIILNDINNSDMWLYERNGLKITGIISFGNGDLLFEDKGIVNKDTVLGVALKWYSKKTSLQEIYPLMELRYKNIDIKYFEIKIPPGRIYGDLYLELLLYVKKQSSNPIFGKANISGMVIDSLQYLKVAIDGYGGLFPISTVKSDDRPLWYIEFNIDDPKIDSFDIHHINICLNSKNKMYANLLKKDSKLGQTLMNQIMVNSLQLIVQKVREYHEWHEIIQIEDYEEGSIIEAIQYFNRVMSWDFSSIEALNESMLLYFEKMDEVSENA